LRTKFEEHETFQLKDSLCVFFSASVSLAHLLSGIQDEGL